MGLGVAAIAVLCALPNGADCVPVRDIAADAPAFAPWTDTTAAPAIAWVATADPLQGASPVLAPRALQDWVSRPSDAPALGVVSFTAAGLWEALVTGTRDTARTGAMRGPLLWAGGILWLLIALAFAGYALMGGRRRPRSTERPGSGVRARARPATAQDWAPRLDHRIAPAPAPAATVAAVAPQDAGRSKSRRRRSASRPLHRRFSYSSPD